MKNEELRNRRCFGSALLSPFFLLTSSFSFAAPLNLPPEPTIAPQIVVQPASVEAATLPQGRRLTIAHLVGSDEIPLDAADFNEMSESLSRDPALAAALQRAGRSGVEIIRTDSHTDLMRRMDATEFDLVFAPSLVYVQQSGQYEVLAQIQDANLQGSAGERLGLLQTSVIFVNQASDLFDLPPITATPLSQGLTAKLAATPLALVSASSAAGYVYPLLTLHQEGRLLEDPPVSFRNTGEEVVLSVLNNLYPMGGCDRATLDRVVHQWAPDVSPESVIHVIASINEVPAPPVVMRRDLDSTLGPDLRGALRAFIANRTKEPLVWQPAEDRMYDSLRRGVQAFYATRRRQ